MASSEVDEYIALGNVFPLVHVAYTKRKRCFAVRFRDEVAIALGIKRNIYFDTSLQLINFYHDYMGCFGYYIQEPDQINAGNHYHKLPREINPSILKQNVQQIAQILHYKKSFVHPYLNDTQI